MSTPHIIPELRPEDSDWPLYVRLLGHAAASGLRELESALLGMRTGGLVVETRPDGYRIGVADIEGGYQTVEAWVAERNRYLMPYKAQIAAWLGAMWRADHPEAREGSVSAPGGAPGGQSGAAE